MVDRADVRKPTIAASTQRLKPANNPEDAITFWRARIDKPLFVYFIQDGGGSVKIGKAHHPISRLAELQCGNPRPLTLRHVVLANQTTEQELHHAWWFARVSGEWFGDGAQATILKLAQEAQSKQIKAADTRPAVEITSMPVEIIKSPR